MTRLNVVGDDLLGELEGTSAAAPGGIYDPRGHDIDGGRRDGGGGRERRRGKGGCGGCLGGGCEREGGVRVKRGGGERGDVFGRVERGGATVGLEGLLFVPLLQTCSLWVQVSVCGATSLNTHVT